jgi:hypothetical protein
LKDKCSSNELQLFDQTSIERFISPDHLQLNTTHTERPNFLTEALNLPQWLDLLYPGIEEGLRNTNSIDDQLLPLIPINGQQQFEQQQSEQQQFEQQQSEQQQSEQQHSLPEEGSLVAGRTKTRPIVLSVKGSNEERENVFPGIFYFRLCSDNETVLQKARFSEKKRKEIKEIRSMRACLRCKRLKKPVCLPVHKPLK